MRTAMQDLIEHLEMIKCRVDMVDVDSIIEYATFSLEKEKEQIINAFEVGYKSCDLDEAFEINRKLASGELYYNQTYNQNK